MKTFSTSGQNGYAICEITSDSDPVGKLSANATIVAGTPFLIAAIFDPGIGVCPDPAKVQFTVTGPDGTVYDTASNTASLFVQVGGTASAYALCVVQPAAGRWSITVRCSQTAAYRADLIGLPSADPVHSALGSAGPYYQNVDEAAGNQLVTDLFGWVFQCLAVVLSAAADTSDLQLAPVPLIVQATGLETEAAQQIWTAAGRGYPGVKIGLTQECGYAFPDSYAYGLPNGDGSAKLAGWTIIANGGQGWSVQQGYATSIEYKTNFAVSTGWCKKSQTIDLIEQVGFTAEYLDQAPDMQVLDYIAAEYPTGTSVSSQYYLTVQLQDANHTVIKTFQTGTFEVPSTVDSHGLEWVRIGCTFSNYGAGIRYIYFEHGGLDAQQYDPQYGLKITGAEADVVTAVQTDQPPELIKNGSGENQLEDWDVIGTTPWTVETGPGQYCPGTPGTTVFSVSEGTGKKAQTIDLLAAGYTPEVLDAAPIVQAAQWICAEPACVCTYSLKFELRDEQMSVITSFDSGLVSLPEAPPGSAPFIYLTQNLSGYGPGLRYIYFEHSASPATAGVAAKIAGVSVHLSSAGPELLAAPGEQASTDPPVPIADTTIVPYRWVCQLGMGHGTTISSVCSGWQIPQSSSDLFVVGSAAHCFKSGKDAWPGQVTVMPAMGNTGGSPYTPVRVPIGRVRVPYNWLAKQQCTVSWFTTYDYAVICVPGSADWDVGGFTPTVEDDTALKNQAGTITAFPADAPYTAGEMYTEPVTLAAWNSTQINNPTNFTPGSSGGAVYVSYTTKVVGIQSYGSKFAGKYIFSCSATRINDDVAADITRWSTPLKPEDTIRKLQMVIRTGCDTGAGTDDDLVCTIDGHEYDLEKLWRNGAGGMRSRNEQGDYDGYDLTSRLNEVYPNGIQLQGLLGKTYSIRRNPYFVRYHSLFNGDWEVESVAIFVNDQLLCVKNFNSWVYVSTQPTSVTGTFELS